MRVIKFRAWDSKSKKMVQPMLFESGVGCNVPNEYLSHTESGIFLGCRFNGFKLMQFTGMTDKNGVDIYEGDILSTDLSRPYLVVEFRSGAFMYQCHDSGDDYYDSMSPIEGGATQDKYCAIIGNIHENPDLLR